MSRISSPDERTPCGLEIDRLNGEIARLTKALSAASGYLINAKIDLETGAPKRTAITTIEGGLRMVRAALNGEKG